MSRRYSNSKILEGAPVMLLAFSLGVENTPVVDVAPRGDVPALDGVPHFVHDCLSFRVLHGPQVRPVEHDVGQNPAGIIGHLDPIRFALQQVTAQDTIT